MSRIQVGFVASFLLLPSYGMAPTPQCYFLSNAPKARIFLLNEHSNFTEGT